MRRREFIAGFLLAAVVSNAEAEKVHRLAIVDPVVPVIELARCAALDASSVAPKSCTGWSRALFEQLRRFGYIEGRNLLVERFSGEGRAEHYPELAREVVRSNPDVIFVIGTRITTDLKASTTTVPIITLSSDPVGLGIVPSLVKPGGNITGVSADAGLEIFGKRLELLKEASPKVSKIGYLASRPVWENTAFAIALLEAAQKMGIAVMWPSDGPLQEQEYRRAFASIPQDVDGLVVSEQNENWVYRHLIVELADERKLPTIYPGSAFVQVGGLMSYGLDFVEIARRVADVIDQILKGQKPGEIPIYQPTKFELVINLKTAKALRLALPEAFLLRADQVIE